jgi:hypothetical protein
VQASRTIPIPADKVALNGQAQAALAKQGPVWQYYQLIDTQWPTVPSSKPSAWNSGLNPAVSNKPGGQPTPVFLTNITMETLFPVRKFTGVPSGRGTEQRELPARLRLNRPDGLAVAGGRIVLGYLPESPSAPMPTTLMVGEVLM